MVKEQPTTLVLNRVIEGIDSRALTVQFERAMKVYCREVFTGDEKATELRAINIEAGVKARVIRFNMNDDDGGDVSMYVAFLIPLFGADERAWEFEMRHMNAMSAFSEYAAVYKRILSQIEVEREIDPDFDDSGRGEEYGKWS